MPYSLSATTARELLSGCPFRVFIRKIIGIPQPSGTPAQNGILLHKAAELYIQYLFENNKNYDLEKWEEILAKLLANGIPGEDLSQIDQEQILYFGSKFVHNLSINIDQVIALELPLALTENFEPTDWDAAAHRGRIDLLLQPNPLSLHVIDYKFTWKTDNEDKIQMEYYAMLLFANYPDVQEITCNYWLIGRNIETVELTYSRKQFETLKNKFRIAYKMLQNLAEEPPIKIPSPHRCPYCSELDNCIDEFKNIIEPEITDKAALAVLYKAKFDKLDKELSKEIPKDEWIYKSSTALKDTDTLIENIIHEYNEGLLDIETVKKVIGITMTSFKKLPTDYKERWGDIFITEKQRKDKLATYEKLANSNIVEEGEQ